MEDDLHSNKDKVWPEVKCWNNYVIEIKSYQTIKLYFLFYFEITYLSCITHLYDINTAQNLPNFQRQSINIKGFLHFIIFNTYIVA